jgi:predicted PurR-regulated permease PerM
MFSRRHSGRAEAMSESQFERLLSNAAQLAIVGLGLAALLLVLQAGQVILAPVTLAIVVGLMFGPVADRVEAWGIPSVVSAALVVLLLIGVIALGVAMFAVPLSGWAARVPVIWERLQHQIANFREPLESLGDLQGQLSSIFGNGEGMTVKVDDGSTVTDLAMIAPAILAQVLIFLASLYFFVATREQIRVSILSLCVTRRMRWRTAHVFRDVEHKVSRYLLSISVINFCLGCVVALTMWAIGMPSPLLWGALAAVLNYIPYIGQAVMIACLLVVGLATETSLQQIVLPVLCYMAINFIEGQFATPHFIGHTMTLNPFLIFLSITYWLWTWGPIGGLVAVPTLLIASSVLAHILPSKPMAPRRPVRRTGTMSPREELLANAAQAIKEQREDQQDGKSAPAKPAEKPA